MGLLLPDRELKAFLAQASAAASQLRETTAEAQGLVVDLRALIARGTVLMDRVERALGGAAAGWQGQP